jgi:hypothetical protein
VSAAELGLLSPAGRPAIAAVGWSALPLPQRERERDHGADELHGEHDGGEVGRVARGLQKQYGLRHGYGSERDQEPSSFERQHVLDREVRAGKHGEGRSEDQQ